MRSLLRTAHDHIVQHKNEAGVGVCYEAHGLRSKSDAACVPRWSLHHVHGFVGVFPVAVDGTTAGAAHAVTGDKLLRDG